MLGESGPSRAYALPPGGVDSAAIIGIVRAMTQRLHDAGYDASWLMVEDATIVGMTSFLRPPLAGRAEIGYGVAEAHRNRGCATRAVGELIKLAPNYGVYVIEAETAVANRASQIALERNGFERTGERVDPEDGPVIRWARQVAQTNK